MLQKMTCATALVLCCLSGCGSGTPTGVKGRVLLDGSPVAKAQVQLLFKGESGGGMHSATTDAQGNFEMLEPGDSNNPIQLGTYVVLVNKLSGGMGAMTNELPDVYQDRAMTPLTVEIKSADSVLDPFQLTSAGTK